MPELRIGCAIRQRVHSAASQIELKTTALSSFCLKRPAYYEAEHSTMSSSNPTPRRGYW
eukprot:IDg1302t1